jgi:putative SOS response-associated peptidase YedK
VASSHLDKQPDTHMVATPVSKCVNTPKNNDAELIAPVALA